MFIAELFYTKRRGYGEFFLDYFLKFALMGLSPAYWGIRSAAGFLAGFVLLLAVSLATNGGIGGGDIKLVALLGIPLGASGLMGALVLSCLYALIHLGIRKAFQKKPAENIPFAPYLFFGCATAMLLQRIP